MSGTQKKILAYCGAAAVLIAGALLKALPGNAGVHLGCEIALIVLGALGFTAPASILTPAPGSSPALDADKTPAETPSARAKQ